MHVQIDEHAQERTSVTVRVPATSANMGPGFDCLGMALNIWSEVTISRSDHFEIVYEGEGSEMVPTDESNLLVTGVRAAFDAAGKPMPLLRYHCVNRIPYARGMGSSSAAIVAGLIGGLVLAGHRLPCWGSEALLQLACSIEGHPDNVAPVIYGGCQLGIHNGERWQSERVTLPAGIQVVLFIPDFIGKTSDARGVLEPTISRQEAIFSIGKSSFNSV
jgi:homoserine kinase